MRKSPKGLWPSSPLALGVMGCLACLGTTQAQTAPEPAIGKVYPTVTVQDKPLEYRQFEKVEITGSSIIRKEQTLALPVQVITRDDIRRSGASNMADVLQNLPVMSMVVNSAAMFTTIGGYTTASMRSLPAGTLLLLNGKRLAAYGRQTVFGGVDRPSVDINTVPLSAIEKIEILSDGASSLYGSDAIAGVINIITRSEQKGFEITAEKLSTTQGGGQGHQLTLNAGKGNLKKDGYSLSITAELLHRDPLQSSDRPQYAQGRYMVERDGQAYAIDGSRLTSYTTPGVFLQPANATTGTPRKVFSLLYQDGQCPSGYVPFPGQPSCQYNTYSAMTIYPQHESRKLLLSGEKWLGEGTTAYAEILHSQLKDSEMAGQGWLQQIYTIGASPTSVGYQEALRAGLDPAKTQFLWSPTLLQGLKRAFEQNNWRVATGLKGEWGGWDYNAQLYKAQAQVFRSAESTDLASQGLVSGRVLTNPNMLKPLTADNPLTATLNGLRVWEPWDEGATRTTVGHLRASRPLMEIQGKDMMLGTGLEWRREATDYRYMANTDTQQSFQAQRDIQAAYLELQLPVTPQWDVTASTRSDRYSDVGTTNNSKLASRYDFDNGWSARASWGTGFRAPSLAQLQDIKKLYNVGVTSFINECKPDMRTLVANLSASNGRAVSCITSTFDIYGNGNPNLKPELSEQKSLGFAYRPTRNFSVTADWWSIDMRDVISTLSSTAVYADPLKYAQFYVLKSNNTLAMRLPNYNIGQRQKSGIDFDVRWRAPTDMGQWNLFMQGTYNLKSKDQSEPGQNFVSDLARYNSITDTITPRLRMRWIAGLTTATWSLHGVLNYTSGYADQNRNGVNMATPKSLPLTGFDVPSFTTLDVSASYQISTAMSLRATIGNVLNRQAPQAFTSTASQVFGFNTREHSLWGRTLSLALTAKF